MTRADELRELPEEELMARLDSAKEELFNLRFQLATGQLDNPMRIRQVRHDVARLLTVLRERELEAEAEEEAGVRVPAAGQEAEAGEAAEEES